ncbi:MAG: MarR family transcriptional regulator [Candidatus Omnitrophica bacterium]|nr:MarR family transcriptional regulator [Candidatus Omnitrophota bacterium]
MRKRELREYILQLDNLLPVLIKHFHIPDPHRLFGIKVTLQQYLTLDILTKKGKCMMTELSQALGVALSTMTELANRLVKRRFVKKIKDSKDHRIVWVDLTRRGLRIIQEINKKKQRHISSILEKLTQHERQILIDILKRISQTVGEAEINSLRI